MWRGRISQMPVQETQHAPSLPRGVASETPVGRGAWQRRTSRPGKGRFETVLPRDHAPESTVSRVAVAETGRSAGKRPISGRPDTRECLTDTCDRDARGRRPIIDRSDTRVCHREHCGQDARGRGGQVNRERAGLRPFCHETMALRHLWRGYPWQKAVLRVVCHATMALRPL